MVVVVIVAALAGYLLGSIPVGYLVGLTYHGIDVRNYGSRRTGATNVLRTLGPRAAAWVAAGDLAKGAAAILFAQVLSQSWNPSMLHVCEVAAALSALAGHNWSVFAHWSGGRGVLVSAGALLVLFPPAFVISAIVAVSVIALSRFVSLGSLVGAVLACLSLLTAVVVGHEPRSYALYAVIGALTIVIQHRDNIDRLRSGTERKLGHQVRMPPNGAA
ncbi:MAG: glycerol-3-phosphate 1-O-acyltransferase PlsY [Chloroflexi bacterium]|nr:glycerol-3-phosphate 1-O-acyltransferase PlsY [Chloroflexota bacterium]